MNCDQSINPGSIKMLPTQNLGMYLYLETIFVDILCREPPEKCPQSQQRNTTGIGSRLSQAASCEDKTHTSQVTSVI